MARANDPIALTHRLDRARSELAAVQNFLDKLIPIILEEKLLIDRYEQANDFVSNYRATGSFIGIHVGWLPLMRNDKLRHQEELERIRLNCVKRIRQLNDEINELEIRIRTIGTNRG